MFIIVRIPQLMNMAAERYYYWHDQSMRIEELFVFAEIKYIIGKNLNRDDG